MKKEQDYIGDIAQIRSMMERSSKFLSLSGWAGILAGIYALIAAYIAYAFFKFAPTTAIYKFEEVGSHKQSNIIALASLLLVASIATAIFLSWKRAVKRNEKIWNSTSQRLLTSMALPLLAGGILSLVFISTNFIGLLPALTLIFYGLALYNAGNYTYKEVRVLGILLVALGLAASVSIEMGLLFWALGFGFLHITYGIYIHIKHER